MKIHSTPMGEVVAICDSGLLGKILREGQLVLDLKRHEGFYNGKKASEEEVIAALMKAKNINLVGANALAAAKKAGIDTSAAKYIQSVPHLQIYRIA